MHTQRVTHTRTRTHTARREHGGVSSPFRSQPFITHQKYKVGQIISTAGSGGDLQASEIHKSHTNMLPSHRHSTTKPRLSCAPPPNPTSPHTILTSLAKLSSRERQEAGAHLSQRIYPQKNESSHQQKPPRDLLSCWWRLWLIFVAAPDVLERVHRVAWHERNHHDPHEEDGRDVCT